LRFGDEVSFQRLREHHVAEALTSAVLRTWSRVATATLADMFRPVSKVVLLVEDDVRLLDLLTRVVTEEGDRALCATTARAARATALAGDQDVIVMDWMLPDGDGAALSMELRQAGVMTPILMLTSKGEAAERVEGLRSGVDDYLVKPFDIEELLLRLAALCRRGRRQEQLRTGTLVIDRLARRATLSGALLNLTAKELELLSFLAEKPGALRARSEIMAQVWNLTSDPGSGLLDVHVSRLREKLGEAAWMIETVRGAGLRLRGTR
jgi:DNA-binding response OmpR family regulator